MSSGRAYMISSRAGARQQSAEARTVGAEAPVILSRVGVQIVDPDAVVEGESVEPHPLRLQHLGARLDAQPDGAIGGVGTRIVAAPDREIADRELLEVQQRIVRPLRDALGRQAETAADIDHALDLAADHRCERVALDA
jgi:hypothetical protein